MKDNTPEKLYSVVSYKMTFWLALTSWLLKVPIILIAGVVVDLSRGMLQAQ